MLNQGEDVSIASLVEYEDQTSGQSKCRKMKEVAHTARARNLSKDSGSESMRLNQENGETNGQE